MRRSSGVGKDRPMNASVVPVACTANPCSRSCPAIVYSTRFHAAQSNACGHVSLPFSWFARSASGRRVKALNVTVQERSILLYNRRRDGKPDDN